MNVLRAVATFVAGSKPRGVSRGRKRTCDAMRKPFVVDAPAPMLKKHPQLSKHARNLFMTLRALADGKTGQLRINGRWMKASVFDRAAEMCRDIRMRAMRELIAHDLVTVERPRFWRMIGGRMRSVLGWAEYTVHREPVAKNHQKAKDSSKVDLQKSISSTVEEIDSQYVSNPPSLGVGPVSGLPSRVSGDEAHHHHQNHHEPDEDDDARSNSLETNQNPRSPVDERTKKLPAALRAWMDMRILKRGKDVINPSAYLRESRPTFLENMAEEVESFLREKATGLMEEQIDRADQVSSDAVYDFLEAEANKHTLPIDELDTDPSSVIWRVIDSAAEILGLVDAEEDDSVRRTRAGNELAKVNRNPGLTTDKYKHLCK